MVAPEFSPYRRVVSMLSKLVRRSTCLLVSFLIINLTADSLAQSGRKPKRNDTPPPEIVERGQPTIPGPPKPADKGDQQITTRLVLVSGAFDASTSVMSAEQIALDSCDKRLKSIRSLNVRVGKGMNRSEATDYAKETGQYVAALEVDEALSAGTPPRGLDDFSVQYYLLEPNTGKVKSHGRVHLRNPRAPGGLPLPTSRSQAALELALVEAGKDVADRLADALKLSLPPR